MGDGCGIILIQITSLISRPIGGKGPESDCLEMICEHGCVEKDNDFGYCCPSAGEIGDSCKVNGEDVDLCCGDGKVCKNGKCESKCLDGSKASETKPEVCCLSNYVYDVISGYSVDAVACGCPAGSEVSKTKPEICCLDNYVYDDSGYSVDAMACGCPGGRQKYTEDGEEKCCSEDYLLPKHGESCNTSCGCFYESSTGLRCSAETNTCVCPDTVWDSLNNKCCDLEKFYIENGQKKCCDGSLNSEKTICTTYPEEEFVCQGHDAVGRDGTKAWICCKTNNYPVDYYYSVTGIGESGRWNVGIYDKNETNMFEWIRKYCIPNGDCTEHSANSHVEPSNFLALVHPGEKACMTLYSNGGGWNDYTVYFKRAR